MLYNYLKVILRNFISDGMFTIIIIFGLAIGLAASLIIAQYVHFELSFDKQHKDRDRIFYTFQKDRPMLRNYPLVAVRNLLSSLQSLRSPGLCIWCIAVICTFFTANIPTVVVYSV